MTPRRAGFTLIEVLLTLVIMTGIMITVTTILNVARQSRDTIHNIQEQQLAGPAILQRLEQDLRGLFLYDRDPRHALLVQNRMLSGLEADTLNFVSATDGLIPWRERPNDPFRRADVNEVGYVLRPSPSSDEFLELYRREDGVEAEEIESWGSDNDEFVGVPARLEIELTLELAPRLAREQLVVTRSEVTYKRILRFPLALQKAQELGVVPIIPRLTPPVANAPGTGAGAAGAPGSGGFGGPPPPGTVTETITTGDLGAGGGAPR